MTTRTIDQIVADWQALDARADDIKWQRGRLAQEAYKIRQLSDLARRVGVLLDTLDTYRRVADAWPTPINGLSFSFHRELASAGRGGDYAYAEHLVAEGKTSVEAVRAELGRKPARGEGEVRRGLDLLPGDRRQEIIREVIKDDPEIVREVSRLPEVRRGVDQEREREAEERFRKAGLRHQTVDPADQTIATMAFGDAVSAMLSAKRSINQARLALSDVILDDELRTSLGQHADRVGEALTAFRQAVSGELDDELARMLDQS